MSKILFLFFFFLRPPWPPNSLAECRAWARPRGVEAALERVTRLLAASGPLEQQIATGYFYLS